MTNMENTSLFSEFEPVSAKQWKQQIQVDLKGADYNETLVWESLEGIKVKPFYSAEDLEGSNTCPLPQNHHWHIAQFIYGGNPALANKKALDALSRGAESLVFQIPDATVDWEVLLNGIDLATTPLYLEFDFLEVDPIKRLLQFSEGKNGQLYLNIDIIGHLAKTGHWYHTPEKDHALLEEILSLAKNQANIHVLGADASLYQNAGANMVQQLAYTLAQANEYLNHFQDHPVPTFKIAIGGNYFFEIAKLRALRWLWKSLAAEYDMATDCHILAFPSKRNKALYDHNANMLRTTSECMSAILGGANTVFNRAYDDIFHKTGEFGERIARNQLLLLKEESYFDEAVNAAEGNYYIEDLTQQLAEKALELFKQMEASGGLLKQLKEGTLQRKIKESADKEQTLFDSGELVLVGTNKFQNPKDRMKDDMELYPFVKTHAHKTLVEPVIEKRLAEQLEQKRLENE